MLTAARARQKNIKVELSFITHERQPLGIFGEQASERVVRLLEHNGIDLLVSASCEVPAPNQVRINRVQEERGLRDARAGDRSRLLEVARVVSLPELFGPYARGLPVAENGFIPIDRYCHVSGEHSVYAAGDATDFPVKHGGIAAQQADTAAESIAASAGAPVRPRPFHPMLDGLLVTGAEPYHLSAWLVGRQPFGSDPVAEYGSTQPPKVMAHHLVTHLEQFGS
jgi:sulfide:quinone oxidoreductase